ncbi:CoA-transferase family III domain-containing protein [Flagelloscypha sp. PMI_526]|nr:CoA-transferase family III domain-containing protein [Flagelloscypha sp. PMI_526]
MALAGVRVIEMAGLAPGPFAGLILADQGAEVIRVDRPTPMSTDILCRGKRSIAIDSKNPAGNALLKQLIASADVLIDPFRPGVMERLGLGPEVFLGSETQQGLNTRLVYARIVGFPRTGPHKDMAGHDINYLALSGVLAMLDGPEKPTFPLNILADFAGGGLTCAMGILFALLERHKSGKGQVVNTDMVSGARYNASFPLLHKAIPEHSPMFRGPRGQNLLDGGSPFYAVYTCQDGRWMSVGCLEPQFFEVFIEKFVKAVPSPETLAEGWMPSPAMQQDRKQWPQLWKFLTQGFLRKPRDFWTTVFDKTDACAVPVLSPEEAASLALQTYGSPLPIAHPPISSKDPFPPAPETPTVILPGQDTEEVLSAFGMSPQELRTLQASGAFGKSAKL